MSRVLIDICHPADVHFFKHIISHLADNGHEVAVVSRPKDVTLQLLKGCGIEFEVLGTHYSSLTGKALGLMRRNRLMRRKIKDFRPDLLMGFASPYAAQMAWYSRIPCITFNDTERAFWGNTATHPFTKYLVRPEFSNMSPRKKGLRFNGIFEQLYLSDRFFTRDPGIRKSLGVGQKDHYFVVRTVAWTAAHDTYPHYLNEEGTSNLLSTLSEHGKVFLSSEGTLPRELEEYTLPTHPADFHQVLASSSLCISEGAKTASEAAILGVPSIIMNSADLGYLHALERSGLLDIEPHPEKALDISLRHMGSMDDQGVQKEREEKKEAFWDSTVDVPESILGYIDGLVRT